MQCCVSFRCTEMWQLFFRFFSHIGYYRVLRRVSVVYSRSILVIYFTYSSMYMSVPTSPFIPPPTPVIVDFFFYFPFIFISCWLITLQYCSEIFHTLTWISHGFTCIPHPDPPSHLPLHSIPLGLPSPPGPSTCLMHPTWAGDLFHPRYYTCFDAVLSKHPTLAFSHRVQKSALYICVYFSVLHMGLSLPSS